MQVVTDLWRELLAGPKEVSLSDRAPGPAVAPACHGVWDARLAERRFSRRRGDLQELMALHYEEPERMPVASPQREGGQEREDRQAEQDR